MRIVNIEINNKIGIFALGNFKFLHYSMYDIAILCINNFTNGGKIMKEVPVWEKSNLTLEEAVAYSGIGINKLRDLTNEKNCSFVLWVGVNAW